MNLRIEILENIEIFTRCLYQQIIKSSNVAGSFYQIRICLRNKESVCGLHYTDGLKVNDAKTNLDAGEIERENQINQRYLRDVFQVVVTSLIFILMFFEFIPASPQLEIFCIMFFTLHENLTSFSSPRLL